jgi:hypothetical protein
MRYGFILFFVFATAHFAFGQVDEIKNASSNSRKGGSGDRSSSSGSSAGFDLLFNVMFSGLVQAQQAKLERKADVPYMVSIDVMFQTAVQPSSYYIFNPRVRANWGLFSSDFRLNYLVEEDFEGYKHIRTNEWQILQFNIVTTKDVVFRVGGGFLQESFGGENYYSEWTTALQVHPANRKLGGIVEYRDADARKEVSGFLRYHAFDRGALHGFLTAGAVYQKYYSTVSVWGMQGGIVLSLY